MSAAKQAEKLEKRLKELLRLPDNKRCANCEAQGPQYAIIDFNIFVCTICSGVHRQFSHRCKGVSMATFKADEVKALEAAGNGVAEQTYLSKWRPSDLPRPVDRNPAKIKDWIDAVYQKKRFYSGEALSRVSTSSLQPTPSVRRMSSGSSDVIVMPMSSVLGGTNFRLQVSPGPSGVPDSTSSAASSSRASAPPDNLLNFDAPMSRPGGQHQQLVSILDESPGSAHAQPQPQTQQQAAFAGGWDAFGEVPPAPQAPAPAAVAPPASGSAWADFGADPFGPVSGSASGVNGRVPEQQAGANGYGGRGAGTALPAGAAPAAGQPAAPADSGGWQAFDAPQANGTVAGPGSAAAGQEQVASPAAAQQKQPEPPKRAELPLDLFGELPPSMPHLGVGVQYGGPRGMMVPQQQLSMPRNGPVPPFPGAQAGFMAQQMFGGFGQPGMGLPSFAQAPQQQQVAGYGGMGGLGGGPFAATAPPPAFLSDEQPREQTAPDPFSGLVPGFRGALPRQQQQSPAVPSAQPAWQSSQPAHFGGGDRHSFTGSGYSSSQPQPVSQAPSRQESFGSVQASQPPSNQAAGPKSGNPFA